MTENKPVHLLAQLDALYTADKVQFDAFREGIVGRIHVLTEELNRLTTVLNIATRVEGQAVNREYTEKYGESEQRAIERYRNQQQRES